MKKLKRIILLVGLVKLAVFLTALRLRQRYASQAVAEDGINAVAIMGGSQTSISSATFSGGYIRAIMGGVELDLRGTAVESKPARVETTVFMGGVRLVVPPEWKVDIRVSPLMGGVADLREGEASSEGAPADLLITGSATMGGLAVASTRAVESMGPPVGDWSS